MEVDGEKVTVYRHERGALRALSATRTHMGCIVQWNGAAQSWDSGHRGRDRPTEEGLCAPATQALRRLRAEELGGCKEKVS
jgi:Rieske Fe-S protein